MGSGNRVIRRFGKTKTLSLEIYAEERKIRKPKGQESKAKKLPIAGIAKAGNALV